MQLCVVRVRCSYRWTAKSNVRCRRSTSWRIHSRDWASVSRCSFLSCAYPLVSFLRSFIDTRRASFGRVVTLEKTCAPRTSSARTVKTSSLPRANREQTSQRVREREIIRDERRRVRAQQPDPHVPRHRGNGSDRRGHAGQRVRLHRLHVAVAEPDPGLTTRCDPNTVQSTCPGRSNRVDE